MKREMMNMINQWLHNLLGCLQSAMVPLTILAISATHGAYPALAEQSAAPEFQTPTEASQTLFQAVQSNNEQAITNILGGPSELSSLHEEGQDRVDREIFAQ